jgi:hypothetical protein
MNISCECCLLSGRGLCEVPIPRPEYSYRVCMSLSMISCNNNPLHLQWIGIRGQTKKDLDLYPNVVYFIYVFMVLYGAIPLCCPPSNFLANQCGPRKPNSVTNLLQGVLTCVVTPAGDESCSTHVRKMCSFTKCVPLTSWRSCVFFFVLSRWLEGFYTKVSAVNGRRNPKNKLRLLCNLAFKLYAGDTMIAFHYVQFRNLCDKCFKYGQ